MDAEDSDDTSRLVNVTEQDRYLYQLPYMIEITVGRNGRISLVLNG